MHNLLFFLVFCFSTFIAFSQEKHTVIIYFNINEQTLSPKNQSIIYDIINTPTIDSIEIVAYTDFLGTKNYNQKLSEKRSKSVYSHLIKNGIPKNKILILKGMGIYPTSNSSQRKDTSDRGIAAHRIAEIRYSIIPEKQTKMFSEDSNCVNTIKEEELEVGKQFVLENIIFYGGTPLFKTESEAALQELTYIMNKYPDLKIEIQGHICCQTDGKDGYDMVNDNYTLSINRAKAVNDFLIRSGIDKNRMTYKGFGSAKKRFPDEKNAEEENLNRRVEIMIVEK